MTHKFHLQAAIKSQKIIKTMVGAEKTNAKLKSNKTGQKKVAGKHT